MEDITVLMLTPNTVPKKWAEYHKKVLLEEIGDTPLITISAKPLDWGTNLIQKEYGLVNLFRQWLRGAKLAKTPYIAIAEDDTLYARDHFEFRPPMDRFAYNFNRWQIFVWVRKHPFYYYKPKPAVGCLIAPRELFVNALENRFRERGDDVTFRGGPGIRKATRKYDKGIMMKFYTHYPVVGFCHKFSIDPLSQRGRKRASRVRAFDIPKWGHAKEVISKFVYE